MKYKRLDHNRTRLIIKQKQILACWSRNMKTTPSTYIAYKIPLMKLYIYIYIYKDDIERCIILGLGIRVGQEVGLNSLEHSRGLFFARFNLLFSDLSITFGVIFAAVLADGSSFRRGFDFDLVRD